MRDAEAIAPIIGIVVKRWPRLSETFVLNEILGLERAGLRLRIYALMDPHEPATQAAISEVQAPVSYLRTGTRADLRILLAAQLALLRTAPWRYLRTLGYVLARRRHRTTFIHLFEAARLVALLRKDGVSHIHAQFAHGPTSVAHFVSLLGDVSFSFTGHAKDIYLSPPDLLAVKIAAARFVATCTAHNVAYLHELAMPADHAKIHLVYHGVATERFCPAPSTKDPGTSVETASPLRMMAVGRLVEKKGYAYLIRACALLRQRGCCYTLAIYGSGPQRGELVRLIDAFGLGDVVQLQGSRTQEELIALYREADLFVLSPQILADGDRDGIPNVLMEAMSIGLPVVATNISGIPELIEDDQSGLLVSPRDEVALANALERLLDPLHGHALRARLGSAGRERVIQHFDAALHLRQMVELLDTEARRDRDIQVGTGGSPLTPTQALEKAEANGPFAHVGASLPDRKGVRGEESVPEGVSDPNVRNGWARTGVSRWVKGAIGERNPCPYGSLPSKKYGTHFLSGREMGLAPVRANPPASVLAGYGGQGQAQSLRVVGSNQAFVGVNGVSSANNGQLATEKPLSAPADHALPVGTNSVPQIPTPDGEPARQEQLQVEGGPI